MRSQSQPPWVRLARSQHGVLSRRQLIRAGLTEAQLVGLLDKAILCRQGAGVYRVTPAPASFDAALWVAVLATGGVLYGSTAAYLWGMVGEHRGPIRIAIARHQRAVAPAGVSMLRRDLAPGAIDSRWRLPVTVRRLAAIDHLVSLPLAEATSFADRALQQGWVGYPDLRDRLRAPARGNVLLRRVLGTLTEGAEAESERLLHRLLREHRITGWVANHRVLVNGVLRARIDVALIEQRIAIEVDGFAYHSARGRYQQDRTRQNLLMMLGWTVLRFTWEDLTIRPDYVLATVRQALQRAS
ncbi:MAG: DUF559 domain-containing protein [Actinomycetota bacterium]|nr:DUF559 domain-containing protein [Actinomycetota bacterium]MDQ2956547.1 DUF559 domain-containing protein [Actinomycetota bacterium]